MSVIDIAPVAAPLALADANPALFLMRDKANAPATVSVPGSSNLDLTLFDVTAIGTVKPSVAGSLVLTLYGKAKASVDAGADDPNEWLPLASSAPEPIGAEGELPETMWMIQGKDMMIFLGSGRLQGTFQSNVANNPIAAIDLEHRPSDIDPTDPLYIFAVGASFTGGECEVNLKSLTVSG